jgi:hypothetical protein
MNYMELAARRRRLARYRYASLAAGEDSSKENKVKDSLYPTLMASFLSRQRKVSSRRQRVCREAVSK